MYCYKIIVLHFYNLYITIVHHLYITFTTSIHHFHNVIPTVFNIQTNYLKNFNVQFLHNLPDIKSILEQLKIKRLKGNTNWRLSTVNLLVKWKSESADYNRSKNKGKWKVSRQKKTKLQFILIMNTRSRFNWWNKINI